MIIVSIKSEENFYEINLYRHLVKVEMTKKMIPGKNSHWKTISIFISLFEGVLILFKKIILARITKNTI
ncbi:MAG: hypothetical protein WC061_02530 [Melioribacteraceae bacterium]